MTCHCSLCEAESRADLQGKVAVAAHLGSPDDNVRRYSVHLKYRTLNLRPLMVCPKGLIPPNFIIKVLLQVFPCGACVQLLTDCADTSRAKKEEKKVTAGVRIYFSGGGGGGGGGSPTIHPSAPLKLMELKR